MSGRKKNQELPVGKTGDTTNGVYLPPETYEKVKDVVEFFSHESIVYNMYQMVYYTAYLDELDGKHISDFLFMNRLIAEALQGLREVVRAELTKKGNELID